MATDAPPPYSGEGRASAPPGYEQGERETGEGAAPVAAPAAYGAPQQHPQQYPQQAPYGQPHQQMQYGAPSPGQPQVPMQYPQGQARAPGPMYPAQGQPVFMPTGQGAGGVHAAPPGGAQHMQGQTNYAPQYGAVAPYQGQGEGQGYGSPANQVVYASAPQQGKITNMPFGQSRQRVYCGSCQNTTLTYVKKNTSAAGWITCLLTCFCCVFCMETFEDVQHYCQHCNAYLGKFESGCC